MGEDDSSGGSTNPSDTTGSGANARITINESDCVYDGDTTPKAPTFMVDIDKQVTTYVKFELDRIPTNVTNEQVEAFFEEAQQVLAQGEFARPPETWRLINGAGYGDGTSTGSMRLGSPTNDGKLVPGQRYVLWCATGGATLGSPAPLPTFDAIYFATVLEPSDTTGSGANARITINESDCVYDGDTTPKAPTLWMDVDKQVTTWAMVELDRIPTNVTNEEVEAFFKEAQQVLAQGGEFAGPPKTWRLINGYGAGGVFTGGMRIGDPTFPDKMLVPGQRYVLWCSTGEPTEGSPPDAINFATVLEPSE